MDCPAGCLEGRVAQYFPGTNILDMCPTCFGQGRVLEPHELQRAESAFDTTRAMYARYYVR
jgi:hypothetical protein